VIFRSSLLSATALLAMAAGPQSSFIAAPVVPPIISVRPQTLRDPNTPPGFTPAPTPNQDAYAPVTKDSPDPHLAPSLFSRKDQYRGESLAAMNSAQVEQERRVSPGAGIKLSMPLQ
jgi:hypothetical protein